MTHAVPEKFSPTIHVFCRTSPRETCETPANLGAMSGGLNMVASVFGASKSRSRSKREEARVDRLCNRKACGSRRFLRSHLQRGTCSMDCPVRLRRLGGISRRTRSRRLEQEGGMTGPLAVAPVHFGFAFSWFASELWSSTAPGPLLRADAGPLAYPQGIWETDPRSGATQRCRVPGRGFLVFSRHTWSASRKSLVADMDPPRRKP